MGEHKSADEVQEEHLRAMGETLGPVYHALYEEVVWLHAKWLEYRKLYAESPRRVDLLNAMAPFFFRVIQNVLWDDVLLHIARLTDPPKSAGKDNLTLLRLPAVVSEPSVAADVQSTIDAAVAKTSFARDWRKRRLAHRDLALAVQAAAAPLPGATREQVEQALLSILTILNGVHRRYFDGAVAFEDFIAHDDAESLVYHLRVAKQAKDRRSERLKQGTPNPEDFEQPPEA